MCEFHAHLWNVADDASDHNVGMHDEWRVSARRTAFCTRYACLYTMVTEDLVTALGVHRICCQIQANSAAKHLVRHGNALRARRHCLNYAGRAVDESIDDGKYNGEVGKAMKLSE